MATFVPDTSLQEDVTAIGQGLPRQDFPQEWSNALKDDYARKGEGSASVADRANQAANGAFVAQQQTAENQQSIEAINSRVNELSRAVNTLSQRLNVVAQNLANLRENPYGSIYRSSSAVITVPDNITTNATFNEEITGRRVTIATDGITLTEAGVYRISAILSYTAGQSFTVAVLVGPTTYFTFSGTTVDEQIPAIDVPVTANDIVRVTLTQNTGGDLDITQGISYLNVSRQGTA